MIFGSDSYVKAAWPQRSTCAAAGDLVEAERVLESFGGWRIDADVAPGMRYT